MEAVRPRRPRLRAGQETDAALRRTALPSPDHFLPDVAGHPRPDRVLRSTASPARHGKRAEYRPIRTASAGRPADSKERGATSARSAHGVGRVSRGRSRHWWPRPSRIRPSSPTRRYRPSLRRPLIADARTGRSACRASARPRLDALGSFVWIRPDQGAGSGAVRRKAEEGAMAEPWQPTTTRRGAVPGPASPAYAKRTDAMRHGQLGNPPNASVERPCADTPRAGPPERRAVARCGLRAGLCRRAGVLVAMLGHRQTKWGPSPGRDHVPQSPVRGHVGMHATGTSVRRARGALRVSV